MELLRRPHPWYTGLPLMAVLAYLVTLTGVWQLVFAAGFVGGVLLLDARRALLLGLGAGALAWGIPLAWAAAYYPLHEAASLLLRILGLSGSEVVLLYFLTVLVGGLATALGAALGAHFRVLLGVARRELEEMA